VLLQAFVSECALLQCLPEDVGRLIVRPVLVNQPGTQWFIYLLGDSELFSCFIDHGIWIVMSDWKNSESMELYRP
jgi:hypothetical protein